MSWYTKSGADSDVILSSRCRLARNAEGLPFGGRLGEADARSLIERTGASLGDGYDRVDFDRLDPLTAAAYVEEHIVSSDFLSAKTPHSLYKNDADGIYIMVCEEDHFRIQSIIRGNAVAEAYKRAAEAERKIAVGIKLAFDPSLGYLTHCPTNLGTAMRISVMMFLPAMKKFGQIASLSESLSKLGFTVRGMYGEGSGAVGCLYQISNSITLGQSEEETLTSLGKLAESVVAEERRLRKKLLAPQTLDEVTDTAMRAYGTLTNAYMMERREFLPLWVEVRLGIALAELAGKESASPSYEILDTLLIEAQPSVLTLLGGGVDISPRERDKRRAALVRERLGADHNQKKH